MNLTHIDKEILDQIPSRYKKTSELDTKILEVLKEDSAKAGLHYTDLYIKICCTINGEKPKWNVVQSHVRKLVAKNIIKRLTKTSFVIDETCVQ